MKQKLQLHIVYLDFDNINNPLLNAGQARATYEVATRLVKNGHRVTVFCSKYPGSKDGLYQGITYKHIGIGSSSIKLNNLVYILTLPFYVRKLQADVIIECFTAPISTLFTPLFTTVPVIGLPSMFAAAEFSKKYHLPFHLIEKFGAKFYKYFLPYSDIDSQKMKQLNPTIKYKIVPQGVGQEYFAIKHKKPAYILFLGRFDISQKGIDLLLKAYAKSPVANLYPLVLAGHGPDEKKIRKLVKELQLEHKVRFAGAAYGKKKEKLIAEAAFVAFPSRHDELSLWALEALASGMPLVTFNLPEGKWAPDTVALKAKPFSLSEYAKLLAQAADETYNKTLRIHARQFARQFTWEHVVAEFEDFFTRVLAWERRVA